MPLTEVWISVPGKAQRPDTVIAFSNFGNLKHKNGKITVCPYRRRIYINGKPERVYRLIAEHFIPKTKEDISLGRNHIDHITHNPSNININDVRNLRWCTNKENHNFDEARYNLGKFCRNKTWKVIDGKRVWVEVQRDTRG